MPPKRKASAEEVLDQPPAKKATAGVSSNNSNGIKSESKQEAAVFQRSFYPPEMSNARCAQYNNNELPRPLAVLEETLQQTAEERLRIPAGASVVHWFKRDLRTLDNHSLSLASQKAKQENIPLICLFIISPEDYEAHLTSACRVDFELRTMEVLRQDLAEKDIPLIVKTIAKRKTVLTEIMEICQELNAKHLFCNIEYEVDELRREEKLVRLGLEKGISVTAVHDDVLVPPGRLESGSGKQYSVYTPWYKTWITHLHSHPELISEHPAPEQNPATARQNFAALFDGLIPAAPENKKLTGKEKQRFGSLWPAGEHEAHIRLQKFLDQRINSYANTRNFPAETSTAVISVHLATGTISARTCVRLARATNGGKRLDTGSDGIRTWISEVAWRDFYKHVLAHWPYVCMSKPFKYEYSNIRWEYNDDHFAAWCQGRTGYPIVDAAMRQMKATGWMHNRCRMIVASFLAKHLLLDWRQGEKFFMESLIDGDFASNNGGWGFSASCGVDPQPYFRIFNPLLQSEKFDVEGEYIRKWIPELKDIEGKAVHDPYGRGQGKLAAKNGYPERIVAHKEARERCLQRYKEGIGRSTA